MVSAPDLAIFAAAALVMVLTPGPNMIYLVSRSLCQGRSAAFLSLLGVASGFLFHVLIATIGLTAIFLAIPYAYDVLRFAGAIYLLRLAWQAISPAAPTVFRNRKLSPASRQKLFMMGFVTCVLNPKPAVFYLSIFTQFLHPERGSIFLQSLTLGCTQIAISFGVNLAIISAAGSISNWLMQRPTWERAQRWLMGTVLAGLGLKLAVSARR
ncbi:MAG: LysE family translocator [Chthoniobacterales bacterium]